MVKAICRGRRACRPVGGSAAATVGADRIRPKLTKLSRSLNGTGNFALHDGSTYSSTPTGRMRSTGCLRKSGVTGGFYPPLRFEWGTRHHSPNHSIPQAGRSTYSSPPTVGEYAQPGTSKNPGLRADSIRPYSLGGEAGSIHRTALLRKTAGGFYPPLQARRLNRRRFSDTPHYI